MSRDLAMPMSEVEAFIEVEGAPAQRPSERVRRELFKAKVMAGAAVGVGLLSLVVLAVAVPRLTGGPWAPASLPGAVGLPRAGRPGGEPATAAASSSELFQRKFEEELRLRNEASSGKLAEVQRGLQDKIHRMKAKQQEMGRTAKRVHEKVAGKGPELRQKIADRASDVLDKTVKDERAKKVLRELAKDKDIVGLFNFN